MVYSYTPAYYSTLHYSITSLCKTILPFSFKEKRLPSAEQMLSKLQPDNLIWQQDSFHHILNLMGLHKEGILGFMSSNLTALWPPPQSSASNSTPSVSSIGDGGPDHFVSFLGQSQHSVSLLNQETLQQRLQALIEGAHKSSIPKIKFHKKMDALEACHFAKNSGFISNQDFLK